MNCREAGRELSGSGNWSVLADERCSRDVSSRGLFGVGAGDDRVRVGAELGALRSARRPRRPRVRHSPSGDRATTETLRTSSTSMPVRLRAGLDQQDDAVPWKRWRRSATARANPTPQAAAVVATSTLPALSGVAGRRVREGRAIMLVLLRRAHLQPLVTVRSVICRRLGSGSRTRQPSGHTSGRIL